MDGNRRWAEENGLPRLEGHNEGEKRIEPIVDRAIELDISYLTFWAFSTENWKRTEEEVEYLLGLLRRALGKQVDSYHKKNVKVKIIGDVSKFPEDIQKETEEWMERTKENTRITVNMALSYGGRDELVRAIRRLIESRIKNQGSGVDKKSKINGQLSNVTTEEFAGYLDTRGQPDPDMIIRTGKQKRLSGFLPYQSVYSELYFTDVLWPDFTPEEFDKAVEWYYDQKRNFGK